ncbi:MAG: RICIN domain-containing protein [Chthoniobacteraceae bacterium]|jgi:hypothetical protein
MPFKNFSPYLLFLAAASISVQAVTATPLQISDGRVTVSMNTSGSYQVSSNVMGWTFAGSLPNPATQLFSTTGSDSVGAYEQISFSWLDASSRQMSGAINLYTGQDTVIFSDTLLAASATAPSPFPNFTTIPQGLSPFGYDDTQYFAPPNFNVGSNRMPWVLFDSHANTVIFSPGSHFLPAQLIGDGVTQMASGFNSSMANAPAGFTQKTIMSLSAGINHTFNIWGLALTNIYGKVRPASDADTILRYFGYWTVDPTGAYYYAFNTNATAPGESAYEATLQDVLVDFTQKGIPVHYLEMDSWWYDKSNVEYNGGNAGGYNSNDPQDQAWGLFGGELNWAGDPNLFPNGVAAFSQALGNAISLSGSGPAIPFACHSRWVDTTAGSSGISTFYSEFGDTYSNDFSGVAGISTRFWDTLAAYAKANNIQHYKQDWQIDIINYSPAFASTVNVGDEFYGNMANAFAAQGVDIDYCMAPACAYLEGGEFSNVNYARVSGDGFSPGMYHDFLYVSRLTSSVGIWPYSDIYLSTQLQDLLLGDLSGGPVGTGDAIGTESASTLLLALRADGVIIKPNAPIMPTDAAFMAESTGAAVALVASTTSTNGMTTTYATAVPGPNNASAFSLSMSDLGITSPAYFYNYFSQTATEVQPGGVLSGQQVDGGGVSFYIIAPVGQSGIAFMGDLNKFVSNGRKRIASVTDQPGQLVANVLFAPTESQITLHGYCGVQPTVTVQSGSASALSYNSATGHFTVAITVSPGTPLNNDIDPARNVTVTFNTASSSPAFINGPPAAVGDVGASYSFSYQTSGNPLPAISLTSGTLPPGLSLSSAGLLSGTPTQTGAFSGTVTASNGIGTAATQNFTITIQNAQVGSNNNTCALVVRSTGMALTGSGGTMSNQNPLLQEPLTTGSSQWWTIDPVGNSQYEFISVTNTNLVANGKGDVNTAGAKIQTYTYIGGQTNSLFTMTPEGGVYYQLDLVNSGLAMSVLASSTAAGASIVQEPYTSGSSQQWTFQPVLASGTYALYVNSTGMCLTPSGGGTANLTQLVQEPYTGAADQLWAVTSLGSGQYNAIGLASGRSLNVSGVSNSAGASIILYDYTGANNEMFTLQDASAGQGFDSIVFDNSGLAMTVSGSSTAAGASIVQEPITGGSSAQWSFRPVSSLALSAPSITNGPPPVTATTGYAYGFVYAATGTPAPSFSVTSGSLPPGLSLSPGGIISGAPAAAGIYSGTVSAINSVNPAATQSFTITVQQAVTPSISNGPPPAATLNTAYSFTYSPGGYPAPVFALTSGALPPGLTLSSAGLISGTPTAMGTYTGTVTVSNGVGNSTLQNFSIPIISTYSQWANGYFGSGSPSGVDTATPENDGIPNLLKYLFDIDPARSMKAADLASLPVVGLDTTTTPGTEYLTLTYRESQSTTGLTIYPQTSYDLQNWTTVNPPNVFRQVGADPATGDPIMETGVITSGSAYQFIRLQVTGP